MPEDILAFINLESRLLDSWALDEWLALFHEDGRYWLPIEEDSDPTTTASLIHDDLQGLSIRVEQLMRQDRISQRPRSETVHFVTNLELVEHDRARATARYNQLVVELRGGDWLQQGLGRPRLYPGKCRLSLVRETGAWKIAEKRLLLLGRRQPLEGLSFLL